MLVVVGLGGREWGGGGERVMGGGCNSLLQCPEDGCTETAIQQLSKVVLLEGSFR